jgi:hypothetical protein
LEGWLKRSPLPSEPLAGQRPFAVAFGELVGLKRRDHGLGDDLQRPPGDLARLA